MPNFLDGFHDVYDYFKYNGSLDQKPERHYPLWLVEVSKILFSDRQDITWLGIKAQGKPLDSLSQLLSW